MVRVWNGHLVHVFDVFWVYLHNFLMHHHNEMHGLFFGLFVVLLHNVGTNPASESHVLHKTDCACLFCFQSLFVECAGQATCFILHNASVHLNVLHSELKVGMREVTPHVVKYARIPRMNLTKLPIEFEKDKCG